MRRAIIVGCDGQDGKILFTSLETKGYRLIGISRSGLRDTQSDRCDPFSIGNADQVSPLVKDFQPEEVYYLAAFHHSSQDSPLDPLEMFCNSHNVHVLGLLHFLEAIRRCSPATRLFYAASSHVFGPPKTLLQDETTPINPGNMYGITKAAGLMTCRLYRAQYSIFASVGILFNHESQWRNPSFVSRKIVQGALKIRHGLQDQLILGDLSAEADWGYAPDYVEAMQAILGCDKPDDFVVATGEKHSVADFVRVVFDEVGIDWKSYVKQDMRLLTRPSQPRIGDPSKLIRCTGWKPRTSFVEMARQLIKAEDATCPTGLSNK